MNRNYQHDIIDHLVSQIMQDESLRVFLAEKGTYGFYTDQDGGSMVSFQCDLGEITFSGNYITSDPRKTGSGWQMGPIESGNYAMVLKATPPSWAVNGATWRLTTVEEHLKNYQSSSRYTEVPRAIRK